MEAGDLQRREAHAHSRSDLELPTFQSLEFETEQNDQPFVLGISQLNKKDYANFWFLTILYLIQGIPVGLAFGSIPFLLKERLSYTQVGFFTFASYPYSLKLLWSPVVDGFFIKGFGRRRSWIVPIQCFSSAVLLILSFQANAVIADAEQNLGYLTFVFGILVFGCATQDIAVDGWALTLLSHGALPYASTAQTIGINTGYFTSFTVFLALSSPEFANKFFRSTPGTDGLVTLNGYLFWCSLVYSVVTLYVYLGKHERDDAQRSNLGSQSTLRIYEQMLHVIRLPAMKSLILVHLVAKIAFQTQDAVTNLKLIEKGLSKEELALVVLIDFPFETVFGYYAAKWSTGPDPLKPWLFAFIWRIFFVCIAMSQVFFFPRGGAGLYYLIYVILVHVMGNFLSTVQFVSITAFHTKIADPEIGGTYMTILNTLCNFGGQWPRYFVLLGVDAFTSATCLETGQSCATQDLKRECPGTCEVHRDGYYVMNIICIFAGLLLFYGFIRRTMTNLQHLPTSMWRCTVTKPL